MSFLLSTGTVFQCSFQTGPGVLTVMPFSRVLVGGSPAANIVNNTLPELPSFVMCMSMANPTVLAATTAAGGILTPMPCTPILTPMIPEKANVTIGGMPCATLSSKCLCAYAGVVTPVAPAQVQTM